MTSHGELRLEDSKTELKLVLTFVRDVVVVENTSNTLLTSCVADVITQLCHREVGSVCY